METKDLLTLSEKKNFFVISGNYYEDIKVIINKLKEKYISPGAEDFDYFEFYIQDSEEEDFYNKILTPPFMSSKKIFVLKDGLKVSKKFAEQINELAKNLDNNVIFLILCIDEEELSPYEIKRISEEKFKNATHLYFESDPKFQKSINIKRIVRFAKEREIEIDDIIAQKMLDFTDGNIYSVFNIINSAYMNNDTITLDYVENLHEKVEFYDSYIFDFLNSISEKKLKDTIVSYRKCLEWKLLTNDNLVMMLLKQLSEAKKNEKSRFRNWDEKVLKKSFEMVYNLLRDLRKYNQKYGTILVEETLIKIIKGEEWI
uniref:DNA polymerase III delta N-terminal domain-containing protein n=1 Tax=candidate division WOR-3 bacterium TaxID=2052148 RepID=A0A7C3NDR4_UNCW3